MGNILNSLFGSGQAGGTTSISSQYEQLMQRQDHLNQMARQQTNNEYVTVTSTGSGGMLGQGNPNIFQQLQPKVEAPPPDLNAMPAMQMGLAELYDLWVVKWGDRWVMNDTLRATFLESSFNWSNAAYRLHAVGKMETWGDKMAYRIIPLDLWK
jgi:hypothetical protein